MIASGFRNPVDLALNQEGELFTFDSDLEFDIGSPWYRPTRVNHVTSASEFGLRSGSAKWNEHFADGNGAVVNVGPGSPTGISFGHHSGFPAYYQDKLFVCDWTFGTIYTIDMEESGSSYTGTKREFLHGTPLNVSAMRFGPDGHMYFLTGGRNTTSKLYRIRSTGKAPSSKVQSNLTKNQTLRNLRHSLETHHKRQKDGRGTINKCWPYPAHEDRKYYFAWLNETLEKSGGKSFAGYIRAIREDAITHLPPKEAASISWLLGEIAVAPNPYNFAEIVKTPQDRVQKVEWSQNSMMPVGTIYSMNEDELKNLVAYLISTGNPKHPAFKKE